jgi:Ca-activated chloride channel homolog
VTVSAVIAAARTLTFATPWLARLAAGAPVVVAVLWAFDRARRRTLLARLGALPAAGGVGAVASPGRRAIKAALAAIALAAILVAAARPQIVGERDLEVAGLDVVVALDVSKSMLVDDAGPAHATRLARGRALATALIDALPGDRIAPIVFAGAAAHFPLTDDHEVAAQFFADLGPADLPLGSNLGEVVRVARCVLRPDLYDDLGCARLGRRGHGGDPLPGDPADAPAATATVPPETIGQRVERGKAIVIVTDGGDPDDDARREVALAHELGIAVIAVGVGSSAGGLVYDIDYAGRRTTPEHTAAGATITSRRDDAALRELCALAGDPARYLVASDRGEPDARPIVAALQQVTRGLATRRIQDKREIYPPFLLGALLALVLDALVTTRRRRRA